MFLRPLNFTGDITLERLRQERLIPHNNNHLTKLLNDKGNKKDTISLATTHYYIHELFKYNKTILLLESNSRFNSNMKILL